MWLIPLAFLKHLKVFYMSSVFSRQAESDKILFALLMLALHITAVRTEAQVPLSQEKQCRKVFAFHGIFLYYTVWPVKVLYTRNNCSNYCDRKANCLILSNGIFLFDVQSVTCYFLSQKSMSHLTDSRRRWRCILKASSPRCFVTKIKINS